MLLSRYVVLLHPLGWAIFQHSAPALCQENRLAIALHVACHGSALRYLNLREVRGSANFVLGLPAQLRVLRRNRVLFMRKGLLGLRGLLMLRLSPRRGRPFLRILRQAALLRVQRRGSVTQGRPLRVKPGARSHCRVHRLRRGPVHRVPRRVRSPLCTAASPPKPTNLPSLLLSHTHHTHNNHTRAT